MKTNSFTQRAKTLIIEGLLVGGTWAFWFSIAYALLITVFGFVATISVRHDVDRAISSSFAVGGFLCIGGIVPAIIVGAIGGALIGLALSFWNRKISSILASFMGFAIGLALILSVNYLIWLSIYPVDTAAGMTTVPFLEYFLSIRRNLLYLVPSMIAILVSPYIGWRIKVDFLKLSEQQIDMQSSEEK